MVPSHPVVPDYVPLADLRGNPEGVNFSGGQNVGGGDEQDARVVF